ncbi:PF07614 family protein [Leptospira inadai serovar Lyme str. 10]|uniref:PF07614 family protein n=2 Tax=Leptospira inadai serovar Lyme TaxID=293084 RepID=V6HN55_9LEPT|nr:PilZ domain-containing protein [Leptospira inadai]EQA38325.1 PF07614 family protein [Leptospira inadai serovar Lyme str. 10]PNV74415.1 PilZ domain-containing protein [Leptospira inadai serovar Lyme]
MDHQQIDHRDLNFLPDREQRFQAINTYLLNQNLYIKRAPFFFEAVITACFENEDKILVNIPTGINLTKGNPLSFFKAFSKYVQLDCVYEGEASEYNYLFKLIGLGIATTARREERIPVPIEVGFASNILTYKSFEDTKQFKIPNIVNDIFAKYQERLQNGRFEHVKVEVFKPHQDAKLEIVRKTMKALFVQDTAEIESFRYKDPSLLNFEGEVNNHLQVIMQKYKDDGIKSELILPIIYKDHRNEPVPLGAVWIKNSDRKIDINDLQELRSIAEEIVDIIRSWNTFRTTASYKIMDISRTGMCLRIQEKKLIETLPKRQKLELDILFKRQKPLPVTATIRWWNKDEKGYLYLGLEFENQADKEVERKRLEKNLDVLSQQYKRLMNVRAS